MKTTRREFLKKAGLGTTAVALPGLFTVGCSKGSKPNIVFIMSDDHAEQAISCYNNKLIQTPNLDRIAEEGVRFENSFVTNSICGPSRATLLTGKYSHKNGFKDHRDRFDGGQQTFPKLLQKAGYKTAIVGKWHLKSEPTGFDYWNILRGQGQYYNPTLREIGQEEGKEYEGYCPDIVTDLALEAMNDLGSTDPFCMMIHFKSPHRNWMPNTKYLDAFEDTEFPIPDTFDDDYSDRDAADEAEMRIQDMWLSFDQKMVRPYYGEETGMGGKDSWTENVGDSWERALDRLTDEQRKPWDAHYKKRMEAFQKLQLTGREKKVWMFQNYLRDYLGCVLSIDENIGRVLDYLDEKGLADNTILVYTSDQGMYLGEHGWYDKRFMYEESLSMPLLMRYPMEMPSGKVVKDMVLNLDFASTFLDYAGIDTPPDIQGTSMRPLMRRWYANKWRHAIYYHYYENPNSWHNVRGHCGVRTERYKLLHFYHEDRWELFDLKTDPDEMNNLYEDVEYADVVVEMKEELERLIEVYEDDIDQTMIDHEQWVLEQEKKKAEEEAKKDSES